MFIFRPCCLLLVLTVIFQKTTRTVSGYIETIEEIGTESRTFRLTCRHLTSIIAILEAEFTAIINGTIFDENHSNKSAIFAPIHPRKALNKRCSGVNHCNFILKEDCPGADLWGNGMLRIKYACVSESKVVKYCNSNVVLPSVWTSGGTGLSAEGFIHNPGYPRLYSGHRKCAWKIQAHRDQKIRLTILDLALSGNDSEDPEYCDDHLDVKESSGHVIFSTCAQEEPPVQIESIGNSLELLLSASYKINPRRGVLVYYTAVGCPTPPSPPEDGYLVFMNETNLQYSCCVGFEFPDSRRKIRNVYCRGGLWSEALPVPDCQIAVTSELKDNWNALDKLKQKIIKTKKKSQNNTSTNIRIFKSPPVNEVRNYKTHSFEMDTELLPPIFIIVILFGLNCAALFYIHRKKKLQAPDCTEEELGTLQKP